MKQLEIELIKTKHTENPNKLQSELKELKKYTLLTKTYTKIKLIY